MRWALIRSGTIAYRGTREQVLEAAERYGLISHVLDDPRDPAPGRGFYADGIEIPPRLSRDAIIMPEDMLPARLRRRAA